MLYGCSFLCYYLNNYKKKMNEQTVAYSGVHPGVRGKYLEQISCKCLSQAKFEVYFIISKCAQLLDSKFKRKSQKKYKGTFNNLMGCLPLTRSPKGEYGCLYTAFKDQLSMP